MTRGPLSGKMVQRKLLGFEKIQFLRHALERMKQRGITVDDVVRCVSSPDVTGLPTKPGRHRVRWKKTAAKAIDVVYEICSDYVRIVTTIGINTKAPRGKPPKILRTKQPQRKPQRRGKKK